MPGRYREPLAPPWEALRDRLPDQRFKHGLSRFMSYCSARDLTPEAVNGSSFQEFGADLESHSLARDPGGLYRDTCKLWNRAAATIPGWPALQVPVPDRRRNFALALDSFPSSFQADVQQYLAGRAEPDVFSEDYCRPARPLTLRTRRQNILAAATALVRSGCPIEHVTSLAVLVEADHAKAALRVLLDRKGGKTTGHIHHIATLLKTIARHHVRVDEASLERLRRMCRALAPEGAGLTEKNKRCLRQFADPGRVRALLSLPDKLVSDAAHAQGASRRHAVRVELGLAIAIELVLPLRIDNLAGLRLDRHIHRIGDKTLLVIPGQETKNSNPIEAELPSDVARLLDLYVRHYRPRLLTAPSPWLFPGENGQRRSTGGFGVQLSTLIRREVGVTMTPHQFRHLAAKLYLDRHPGDHETVRRLLGHKSLVTTMRFYRELDSVLAVWRHGEVVTELLASNRNKATGQRRPKHGGLEHDRV
jgi:hypothetical protein